MRKRWIWLAVVIPVAFSGCGGSQPKDRDLLRVKSAADADSKKVILLMVDSLMARAIDKGVRSHRLPSFRYLIEHGQYYSNIVSSFPTMSVTIDSSLLTGAYPDAHRIPALNWYSINDKKWINYGTGPMEVAEVGIHPVLSDALIGLNGSHLSRNVPTVYEELARRGLKAGSINGLIYRGASDHTLSIPLWLQGTAALPKEIRVKGPELFMLGALSNPFKGVKELPDGLTKRMGIHNESSIEAADYLVRAHKLPDFLFVYLPDMDRKMHKKGPSEEKGIMEVDRQLGSLLQAFGSPDKALDQAVIMVLGDSGMTQLLPADRHPVVELSSLLEGYRVAHPGDRVAADTDIVMAVNETMAFVYPLMADPSFDRLARSLAADDRIDFVAWKERGWTRVLQGGTHKQLRFKEGGSHTDPYNQSWTVEQNREVLDIRQDDAAGKLAYGQYPDALRRLSAALDSHRGPYAIVTAKPGYELADKSSPTHRGGGGHGSIGREESLVPLIISGTDRKPSRLRIVDLKAYILELLSRPIPGSAQSK